MSVSVEFRGNFLLVGREGKLEQIVLPNCDRNDLSNPKRRKRFIDNNNRAHFAGMVVAPAIGDATQYPMDKDVRVTIGDPKQGAAPSIPITIARGLPNLNDHKLLIESGTTAARIEIYGGSLAGYGPNHVGNPVFTHSKASGPLCLSVVWTLPGTDGAIVQIGNESISIAATDTVIVYSYDHRDPFPHQLREENDVKRNASGIVIDEDFEWLYQLFSSWPDPLESPTAPTPFYQHADSTQPGTRTYLVSSCFPGGDFYPPEGGS